MVFLDPKRRSEMERRIASIISKNNADPSVAVGAPKTPIFKMSSRVLSNLRADELSTATRKWQAREISNVTGVSLCDVHDRSDVLLVQFTYLSILNQLSGRTPSDATQYPIFRTWLSIFAIPFLITNVAWVLADYTSTTLDLMAPESYRE